MGCCLGKGGSQQSDAREPLVSASPHRTPRYKEVGYNPYGAANGAGADASRPTSASNGDEQLASLLDADENKDSAGAAMDKKKSLKALKTHKKGTRRYLLHQKIRKIFEEKRQRLHEVVLLPPGEDRNEWIAVHVIDFYNDISLLYGTIAELCTQVTCPIMSAGTHRYLWADGVTFTTPIKVPAKEYVHYLMNWVDDQLSDEDLFPTQENHAFSPDFLPACKTIFKRLFRVYAHLYHHHFKEFVQLGVQQHLNLCFKRFVYFVLEFDMVARKELEPLSRLIAKIEDLANKAPAAHK